MALNRGVEYRGQAIRFRAPATLDSRRRSSTRVIMFAYLGLLCRAGGERNDRINSYKAGRTA